MNTWLQVKLPVNFVHETVDIGVIKLDQKMNLTLQDFAFRNARLLEDVVIAGYPPVPRSLEPVLTFYQGQICGHLLKTIAHSSFEELSLPWEDYN